MHDALLVNRCERVRGLRRETDRLHGGQPARRAGQPAREVFALEQFHDDEQLVLVLLDLVDHGDSSVLQPCTDQRLVLESLE